MGFLLYLLSQLLTKIFYISGLMYAVCRFLIRLDFKGLDKYFFTLAISIDQTGNVLMSPLFNDMLISGGSLNYFGNPDETISSVIGKNKANGTLSVVGKFLDFILDKIDPNHSIDSIEADE